MKAYAPSDRGSSAAVVVSQELLTAAVTGLQPTKETIFFYFAKYLCCQQGYNQGEKKLRQCSFLYHFILCYMSILPEIRALAARGRKRLNNKACDWTNCILSQPFTPFLTWTFNVTNFAWGWDKYKILVQYKRKEGEEGFWRNPAILWLRRAAGGRNMRQITQEKTGKLPKAWWWWSWWQWW